MDIQRGLAGQNPAAYRPDLAMILTNLGVVYRHTQRFGDAESAYKEALGHPARPRRPEPRAYRPAIPKILINLGTVYRNTQRFGDAESAYKEALDIRRGLAAQNPAAYRPAIAKILARLWIVYDDTQRFGDAERLQGSLGHPARPRRPEPRRLPARPRHNPHQSRGSSYSETHRLPRPRRPRMKY